MPCDYCDSIAAMTGTRNCPIHSVTEALSYDHARWLEKRATLQALGHVLNYVSGQWYETEYGQVENKDRWYAPAMYFVEKLYAEVARDAAR